MTEHPPIPKEPTEPSLHITIAAALFPDAAAFLRAHGCIIAVGERDGGIKTTVTLPAGSTRKLMHGRAASERHEITLPDKVVIVQVYDSGTGHSALFVPAQAQSTTK
jgi:hypothetical protein